MVWIVIAEIEVPFLELKLQVAAGFHIAGPYSVDLDSLGAYEMPFSLKIACEVTDILGEERTA